MYHFWDAVIEPLLECLNPRSIVEIGSDYGENTRRLLDYCRDNDCVLHVVDPLPKYDVDEWNEQYGDYMVFHRDLSLDALGSLYSFDLVLVDGDHNWYTVYHELELLDLRCIELEQPFPMVLLHDIHWPYGRRDLYYDPDRIPVEHRQPHKTLGIRPGQPDLLKQGGFNQNFHNAIFEHDLKNGVLTAVEDFERENKRDLRLVQLPGIYGLGLLFTKRLVEGNRNLRELLERLQMSRELERHIREVEAERLGATIEALENKLERIRDNRHNRERAEELQQEIEEYGRLLKESQKVAKSLRDDLGRVNEENEGFQKRIGELEASLKEEANKADLLATRLDEAGNKLIERESGKRLAEEKLEQTQAGLEESRAETERLNNKLASERQRLRRLEADLAHHRVLGEKAESGFVWRERKIDELKKKLRDLEHDMKGREKQVEQLSGVLEKVRSHVETMSEARSFRLGESLANIRRKLRLDSSPGPLAAVKQILDSYEGQQHERTPIESTRLLRKAAPEFRADFSKLGTSEAKKRVLLVAHSASNHIYGGERSFIDIVRSIDKRRFEIVCVFPSESALIFDHIRGHADEIVVARYGWWKDGNFNRDCIELFRNMLLDKRIDIVHVNTIMLIEPLLAARSLGIPCLLHSREIITRDSTLAGYIGLDPDTIVDVVLGTTDYVIGNSRATCELYDKGDATFLLYNGIDTDEYKLPSPSPRTNLKIGLVSSNLPKKGIEDFAQLARLASESLPGQEFRLIGRHNEHVRQMQRRQREGELPGNLFFDDYREDITDCYRDLDVVVNFSHFAESFGRTVAEAMAFSRPVICYEWGALPELVEHGQTGFLIPYRRYAEAIEHLRFFVQNPGELAAFGRRGRERVEEHFSLKRLGEEINRIYKKVAERSRRDDAYRLISAAAQLPDDSIARQYRTVLLDHPDKKEKREKGAPLIDRETYTHQRIDPRVADNLAQRRKRLKIAYFLWHFPVPSETFVLNELRQLVEKGYDVKVFCRGSPHEDFEPDFPIEYHAAKSPEHLAELLVEHGRNVVHSHFVYPTVTEFVRPACEKAGIGFTFIVHGQDIFRYENIEKNRVAEVVASPWCLRVLVPGEFHRRFLIDQGVPAGKIVKNPQAIEFDFFSANGGQEKTASERRSLCAISRFVEKKGFEHLIRAGKELASEGIDIYLYGYGPLEERYREIIREEGVENVKLMGACQGKDEVRQAIQSHDLFVLPAVRAVNGDMDGVPTVLMEAMACGIPVLTTPVSSIPELVVENITGFLCRPGDVESLVSAVRGFYTLDRAQVYHVVRNARRKIRDTFSIDQCVRALVRLWQRDTIDIVLVSYHNLPELQEVIRRIYHYTNTYFNLIVVDNASPPEVRRYLAELKSRVGNMKLIENPENVMVGPATNTAVENGSSRYVFYLCAKEGFVLGHGWERKAIEYMDEHPDVGMAGTIGYSPSYFDGRGYAENHPHFASFRNQEFALQNPDRPFGHVQGGLFALRRHAFEEIGGFSEKVPHVGTDVEYSYYMESRGWKLGSIPSILSLYNKTLPPLGSRFDESVLAAHPLSLDNMGDFDRIVSGEARKCNVCGWLGKEFDRDGRRFGICPQCGSTGGERALYKHLAESHLTYRKLMCLDMNPGGCLSALLQKMFSYQDIDLAGLDSEKLPFADGSIDVAVAPAGPASARLDDKLIAEMFRILKPGGLVVIQPSHGYEPAGDSKEIEKKLSGSGFETKPFWYSSAVLELDPCPVYECRKPRKSAAGHLTLAISR